MFLREPAVPVDQVSEAAVVVGKLEDLAKQKSIIKVCIFV